MCKYHPSTYPFHRSPTNHSPTHPSFFNMTWLIKNNLSVMFVLILDAKPLSSLTSNVFCKYCCNEPRQCQTCLSDMYLIIYLCSIMPWLTMSLSYIYVCVCVYLCIYVYYLFCRDIFTSLRGPPKGLLLFGPPGTGKTLIGITIEH